ncbi:MAG: hypothetical protein M9894_01305 [Planctomycetes bacterium]|nr:hypothetical protein [Planctomycetota bacterium]
MEDLRELERRVRASYDAVRAGRPRTERRATPAAALDALLRAPDHDDGRDADALRATGLCGAFTPVAARRALTLAGRPFACGTLVVTSGTVDLALLFTTSGAKALLLGRAFPPLGRRLVEKDRLKSAELGRLEAALRGRKSEQDALLALGVAPDLVTEAAAEVVGQVLLDAVFWTDPTFEAGAGEAEPELRERRDVDVLTLNARAAKTLVQQVGEKLNELAPVHRGLPGLRVTLAEGPRANERSASLSARAVEVLSLLQAQPGLLAADLADRLAEAGHARPPLHALARDLQGLVARGLVVATPLRPAAPPAFEEGLAALPRRLWSARQHFEAGDRRAAARHLSRAGTDLLARGRAADASRCLAAAHGLQGDDLEAHDGLVKALVACGERDEARLAAEALARRYLDARLPARARRVLQPHAQGREEPTLGLLLLEAALAAGEVRAVPEMAERGIAALRQEGRRADAQAIALALADHVPDAAGRERVLRAGGVRAASPAAGRAGLAAVVLLAAALVPAVQALQARQAYARTVADAQAALARHDLDAVAALLEAPAAAGGDVGQAARGALARAREHEQDAATLRRLRAASALGDVDEVLRVCEGATPRTESLAALLDRAAARARARRQDALLAVEGLTQLVARGDLPAAYARARRLREELRDVPGVLRGLALDVRITSNPGAQLRWNRAVFAQPTPFTAKLPLLEERDVEVSLAGHETVRRVISVMTDGPVVHIPLRTTAEAAADWTGATLREVVRGEAAGVRLASAPRALDGVGLPAGWRARVDAVHEPRQGQLVLVALVVTLEERQAGGWAAERPVSVALPTPFTRTAVAQADGARVVAPLERAPGADLAWVREQVQRALAHVLERREGGR